MSITILNKMKTSLTTFLTFLSVLAMGQQITVSGTVTSAEDQQPMIGVNVVIMGTTLGASTNYDGAYTLQANPGDTLQFSFIGYQPQNIPVNGRSQINVILATDEKILEDVTVVGYKKEIKSNVSTAITS